MVIHRHFSLTADKKANQIKKKKAPKNYAKLLVMATLNPELKLKCVIFTAFASPNRMTSIGQTNMKSPT